MCVDKLIKKVHSFQMFFNRHNLSVPRKYNYKFKCVVREKKIEKTSSNLKIQKSVVWKETALGINASVQYKT